MIVSPLLVLIDLQLPPHFSRVATTVYGHVLEPMRERSIMQIGDANTDYAGEAITRPPSVWLSGQPSPCLLVFKER